MKNINTKQKNIANVMISNKNDIIILDHPVKYYYKTIYVYSKFAAAGHRFKLGDIILSHIF